MDDQNSILLTFNCDAENEFTPNHHYEKLNLPRLQPTEVYESLSINVVILLPGLLWSAWYTFT